MQIHESGLNLLPIHFNRVRTIILPCKFDTTCTHATLTDSCDNHMTRQKMIRRSRFRVCVRDIVLLATLRDASKKQAEERAFDVEEAADKGSSVENVSNAVATFR